MISIEDIPELIQIGRTIQRNGSQSNSSPAWNFRLGLIEEGSRNDTLFRLARIFFKPDLTPDQFKCCVQGFNKAYCNPPLPESEVISICESVSGYHDDREDKSVRAITGYLMQDDLYITVYEQGKEITFKFDGKVWKTITPLAIKKLIRDVYETECEPEKINKIHADLQIGTYVDVPEWNSVRQECIPCFSFMYDCETGEEIAYLPEHYLKTKLDVDPDFDMETPIFDQCLRRWFGDDESKKVLLLEFIAYCLTPQARLKKCLICLGAPNTGKSLIGDLITDLLGRKWVSNTKIHKLNDEFGKASLLFKYLNIDDEPQARDDKPVDETAIKMIVGNNPTVEVNAKHRDQVSVSLICKLLILANKLPRIEDISGAAFERMLFLTFDNPIPPSERDTDLLAKLRLEYPGIVAKAIRAFSGLIERDYQFTVPDSSKEALTEYQNDNDPIYQFMQVAFIENSNATRVISASEIHGIYERLRKAKKIPDITLPKLSQKALTEQINRIDGYEIKPSYCSHAKKSVRGLKGYGLSYLAGGVNEFNA